MNPAQLRRGIAVEMEHTSDPRLAAQIALDHLCEDRAYYIKLAKIHLDGLGAAPHPTAQAAAAIVVAFEDGRGDKAIEILRRFNPLERVGIGMQAIELGADPDSMALAIRAAATTPAEAQQTEIEMEAEYVGQAFKPKWYRRRSVQFGAAAIVGLFVGMLASR